MKKSIGRVEGMYKEVRMINEGKDVKDWNIYKFENGERNYKLIGNSINNEVILWKKKWINEINILGSEGY